MNQGGNRNILVSSQYRNVVLYVRCNYIGKDTVRRHFTIIVLLNQPGFRDKQVR
jgi:hypothetical protein